MVEVILFWPGDMSPVVDTLSFVRTGNNGKPWNAHGCESGAHIGENVMDEVPAHLHTIQWTFKAEINA